MIRKEDDVAGELGKKRAGEAGELRYCKLLDLEKGLGLCLWLIIEKPLKEFKLGNNNICLFKTCLRMQRHE